MREKVLEVKAISKQYNDKIVVDNVSFSVYPGEIVGLIGANGAGKSTLLKMISHLVIPSKGEIYFKKYSISEQYEKALQKMGINFFDGMLINSLSAYQNLCLRVDALQLKGDKKRIVKNVIDIFDMAEYSNVKCDDYSLGMKQRAALAMSSVGNPDLLLLDEPMNGLDPSGIKSTRTWLIEMSNEGVAAIISSHLLYDIEKLCNRILIMSKGKLLVDMKVDEIVNQFGNIEDFYFGIVEDTL